MVIETHGAIPTQRVPAGFMLQNPMANQRSEIGLGENDFPQAWRAVQWYDRNLVAIQDQGLHALAGYRNTGWRGSVDDAAGQELKGCGASGRRAESRWGVWGWGVWG